MSKKTLYFRRTGNSDVEQYEGDEVVEKDDGTFEVRDGGKQIAEVNDAEWHTVAVHLSYDDVWETIDQSARKHLKMTGEEFMHRYFTDQMSYYHLPIFRTLCHMADLIDSEYLEKHSGIHTGS